MAALECRDAGRRVAGVNTDREGSLVVIRIVLHHLPDLKLIEAAADDRRADQSARIRRHKIDMRGREFFCGDDDIALILPVLIVNDNEHPAGSDVRDRLFNRCKV